MGYWRGTRAYLCGILLFFFCILLQDDSRTQSGTTTGVMDVELVREINSVSGSLGCLEAKRAAGFVTSNYHELSTWQHYFCLALCHSCLNSMIPSDNGSSNIKTQSVRLHSFLCPLSPDQIRSCAPLTFPFFTPLPLHFRPVALVDLFYAIHHLIVLTH
jgi:hypothetical protein